MSNGTSSWLTLGAASAGLILLYYQMERTNFIADGNNPADFPDFPTWVGIKGALAKAQLPALAGGSAPDSSSIRNFLLQAFPGAFRYIAWLFLGGTVASALGGWYVGSQARTTLQSLANFVRNFRWPGGPPAGGTPAAAAAPAARPVPSLTPTQRRVEEGLNGPADFAPLPLPTIGPLTGLDTAAQNAQAYNSWSPGFQPVLPLGTAANGIAAVGGLASGLAALLRLVSPALESGVIP